MAVIESTGMQRLMLPSTVDLIVDWLKSRSDMQAIIDPGSRISSTLPVKDSDIVYPWLTISRVIGVPVLPEAGLDRARITFNSWGGVTSSGAPNWADADLLIRTVENAISSTMSVHIEGKGLLRSLSGLEGIQQLQDPDTGGARWWMDAIIVAQKEQT